jgi:hypothetical protein
MIALSEIGVSITRFGPNFPTDRRGAPDAADGLRPASGPIAADHVFAQHEYRGSRSISSWKVQLIASRMFITAMVANPQ